MRINILRKQYYIPLNSLNVSRQVEFRVLSRYLSLRATDILCDMGCGDGYWSKKFARMKSCRVFGIDLNPTRINDANKSNHNNISFITGNIHNLPYKSYFFTKIVSICVLEHLEDDIKVLKEMRRVILDGGILAITVDSFSYPNISDILKNNHKNSYHVVNYYSYDKLEKKLSDSGFKILDHKFITNSPVSKILYEFYIRHRKLSYFLFPLAYPLSILSDSLFGSKKYGFKLAIKAQAV